MRIAKYIFVILKKKEKFCKKGFLSFEWWKCTFATFGYLEKTLLAYPSENPLLTLPWKKSLRRPLGVHAHLSKCWRGTF